MSGKGEAGLFVSGFGFEHSVAGFFGAAGLGNDQTKGLAQRSVELIQDAIHAVGVGIVEEEQPDFVGFRVAERMRDELRSESRAADADEQQLGERAIYSVNSSSVHVCRKLFDSSDRVLDFGADFGVRRQFRIAQPIMANHPVFVGVGDGAFFEGVHGDKRLVHPAGHFLEVIIRKIDPAQINRQADLRKGGVVALESLPGLVLRCVHEAENNGEVKWLNS
jgi:hypothetical protein